MRHTEKFLHTLLKKMLKTFFIEISNENNSIMQEKIYERVKHLNLLKINETIDEVLEVNDCLSGIIGVNGEFYLVQKAGVGDVAGKGYNLFRLLFDDIKATQSSTFITRK